MSEGTEYIPNDAPDDIRQMLAVFCEKQEQICVWLSGYSEGPALLEEILADVRAGRDVLEDIQGLVEEYASTRGENARGLFSQEPQNAHAAGTGVPRPVTGGYRCPQGRCARTWDGGPGEKVPVCHVDGTRFARAREW